MLAPYNLSLISRGIGSLMTIGTPAAVLMCGKKVVHKKDKRKQLKAYFVLYNT